MLAILENFKKSVDEGNKSGVLSTNLSKAFDCIDHKVLIAMLFWYGVSPTALNLIHSYLTNRTQRIKINNSYSRRSSIKYGVPQGSVLGLLLFNIYLIGLLCESESSNITNYADNTTPYACGENIRAALSQLQSLVYTFFKWFETTTCKEQKTEKVVINDVVLNSSVAEKLLGITLDSELKFDKHITGICNKASQKIHVLSRIIY